jgi:glycerate dehydrogenase
VELDGLTFGILGYGKIGKETARIGRAFGMKVIAHSRSLKENVEGEVEAVNMDTLFGQSDILSLHCPLTPETDRVVDSENLAKMKSSAFLINTGRGQLVDEEALADALNAGHLAGAGLDVLSSEPPSPDNPLPQAKNCFVSPHIAWATYAARKRLLAATANNLRSFIDGKTANVVNGV